MTFYPQPKPQTHRNPKYLAFIREQPCIATEEKAEPHHEPGTGIGGGMSKKCSDYCCIPMNRETHDARERLGFNSFWQTIYDHQRPDYIIIKLLSKYLEQIDPTCNAKRVIINALITEIEKRR